MAVGFVCWTFDGLVLTLAISACVPPALAAWTPLAVFAASGRLDHAAAGARPAGSRGAGGRRSAVCAKAGAAERDAADPPRLHERARAGPNGPTLAGLVLATVAEGFGLASLLPALTILMDDGGEPTLVHKMVYGALDALGLPANLEVLLLLVLVGVLVKAALVALALIRVGYAVADVATDLRTTVVQTPARGQVGLLHPPADRPLRQRDEPGRDPRRARLHAAADVRRLAARDRGQPDAGVPGVLAPGAARASRSAARSC